MKRKSAICALVICVFLTGLTFYACLEIVKSNKESRESLEQQALTGGINCEFLLEGIEVEDFGRLVKIEPQTGYEWNNARSKYENCRLLWGRGDCYQWVYSDMITCLSSDGKFINDDWIRTLITGGASSEECHAITEFCAQLYPQEIDTQTQYFLEQSCIQDLKIRCFGSR